MTAPTTAAKVQAELSPAALSTTATLLIEAGEMLQRLGLAIRATLRAGERPVS